jgi:hypothetical protein
MAHAIEGGTDDGTGATGSDNANTKPWGCRAVHRASSRLGDQSGCCARKNRTTVKA